jgi:Holliday junction resolvase RusA-like endonuclease
MTTCTIVIPGKPRQKGNSKRIVRFGPRMALVGDKKTVEAEANAKGIAWQQRPEGLLEGALTADVDFVFAIPASRRAGKRKVKPGDPHTQRPDRGNLLKLIEDVLEGVVYSDDCTVADGRVRKVWGERDETVITITTTEQT